MNSILKLKRVSVIIPTRNEEKFIAKCLDSIISQDYPSDRMEILVVDGVSYDNTKKIVQSYSQKYPSVKLLDNISKYTSYAFNIGIKRSSGEVIMFMGAHAGYKKNYISKCLEYLERYDADNVGGVLKTIPREKTIFAKVISLALSSRFGAGSHFRIGSDKIREVDTVFGGCYRKDVFDRVGLFNENLKRSQDLELNLRLRRAGGKIIIAPDIVLSYYPKSSLRDFAIHNFEDGVWAVYPVKFIKMPLKLRHYIPLIFVSVLVVTLAIGIFVPKYFFIFILITSFYLLINLYFSAVIAIGEKRIEYIFLLPIVFIVRHIFYGLGSLWGLIKLTR
jgi:glycosyltransferase involved in cell wall biosynthesis